MVKLGQYRSYSSCKQTASKLQEFQAGQQKSCGKVGMSHPAAAATLLEEQ
jgi:hypothetical protein